MGNPQKNKLWAYVVTLPQYLLPHHLLSKIVYGLVRWRWSFWKNLLIKLFIRYYQIDRDEVLHPDLNFYPDFNHFFIRDLRPDARPIAPAPDAIISPVDARISALGAISGQTLFQAKGHHYHLDALLGGEPRRSSHFSGGHFITLYLAPRDYHRIHMPVAGRLCEMIHIPGRLFAVNPSAVQIIPGLFARNERVVAIFDTVVGPMALILVGALFVGSIETVWAGTITPQTRPTPQIWTYPEIGTNSVTLGKGAEMGRFNMGSTVIILFGANAITWEKSIAPGELLRMGERIGTQLELMYPGGSPCAIDRINLP